MGEKTFSHIFTTYLRFWPKFIDIFAFYEYFWYTETVYHHNVLTMHEIVIDEYCSEKIDKEYLSSYYDWDKFEVCLVYLSQFSNTKHLRNTIIQIGELLGIDATWINRLVLITDELNNNAIEYGSKNECCNRMYVSSHKVDWNISVSLEVEDTGRGIYAKKAWEMDKLREERKEINYQHHASIRGRGLFLIISRLVDELYFQDSPRGWLIVGIRKTIIPKSI